MTKPAPSTDTSDSQAGLRLRLQSLLDHKTKPLGALGRLEELAMQIGLILNTENPELTHPHLLVFAADHGLALQGVSAYPREVTGQMVLNFCQGGAAINVLCRQHAIELKIVDAGVDADFAPELPIVQAKVARGTADATMGPAMMPEQLDACKAHAESIIQALPATCNVVGFGEMGIGNTSSAALLMHCLTGEPLEYCVGRGTGLSDTGLSNKLSILGRALVANHGPALDPIQALLRYGGLEIAMMAYAMQKAAVTSRVILIDGFIASAAWLCAVRMSPSLSSSAIFCTQSAEAGHILMLKHLDANPILSLGLRLGEGTGCALAYPILISACNVLADMASFDSAGVSEGDTERS